MLLETAIAWFAIGIIAFATQQPCLEPATDAQLRDARIAIALVLAVSVLPWVVAALLARRHRSRYLALGLVAAMYPSYAVYFVLFATPSDWAAWNICF